MDWSHVIYRAGSAAIAGGLATLILIGVGWCQRKLEAWEERRKEK